jgi:hypothetical protein
MKVVEEELVLLQLWLNYDLWLTSADGQLSITRIISTSKEDAISELTDML